MTFERDIMQVARVNDFSTHATIGNTPVEAFEIAQSVEFFRVLSEALYSDKPRAMVREILCNAWDAHIAVGCTDVPIEVTLTDDVLIIQDRGPGIKHEMMKPTYCTYGGGSTKTHDGRQTGGFSLGSKAPFAYTEHFEVQSCYQGTKSVYNLSMASLDVDGKPGCQRIVSMPTSETGLRVTIQLKNSEDKHTLFRLVTEIASFGEMNVLLNGSQCQTIPFSKAKHGFALLQRSSLNSGIYVRYGSVLYPVPRHEDYGDLYQDAVKYCSGQTTFRLNQQVLVLLAEPNTIAVTPSRESLSLTELTLSTVKKLLENFTKQDASTHMAELRRMVVEEVDKCWLNCDWGELYANPHNLLDSSAYPRSELNTDQAPWLILTPEDLASNYIRRAIQDDGGLRRQALMIRLEQMIASGLDRNGLLRSLLEDTRLAKNGTLFSQNFLRLLHRGINRSALLSPSRLFLYRETYAVRDRFKPLKEKVDSIRRFALAFARGLLVVAHSRTNLAERADGFPIIKHCYNSLAYTPCYIVPRNRKDEAEAAIRIFTQLGFKVLDLTRRQPWEPAPEPKQDKKIKRATSGGMVALSSLWNGSNVDISALDNPDTPRIFNPEFVVKVTPSQEQSLAANHSLPGHTAAATRLLFEEYTGRGAIARTQKQYDKALANGALPLDAFMKEEVLRLVARDKAFQRYREHRAFLDDRPPTTSADEDTLLALIARDEVLSKAFGIFVPLTARHKMARTFLGSLANNLGRSRLATETELLGAVKLSPESEKLIQRVKISPKVRYLAIGSIRYDYNYIANMGPHIRAMILEALKG